MYRRGFKVADQVAKIPTTRPPNRDFFYFEWWVGRVTWTGHFCECGCRFDVYMQKKHTILCWIFEPNYQFLSYIFYILLHTELYASALAGSSFSSTSAVLATPFFILQRSMMSTAKQVKNVAGHQAKCIVVLGLVLKHDIHDETKG